MARIDLEQVVLESTEKPCVEIKVDENAAILTEEQRQIVQHVYQSAKNATESILHNPNIDTTLAITQISRFV